MLHKAKLVGDAVHGINNAATEAADMTRGAKKRKMVAAVPAYLKSRVGRGGEELPSIDINSSSSRRRHGRNEMMIADVMEFVTGGKMPREVFVDLMGYLVPKWDETRRA